MSVFAAIRADPGGLSLNTMLAEVEKLLAVRAIGLPAGMFADVAPKILAAWRARAAAEAPSHLRAHPAPTRAALVCALLWARERELTDTLVDLLISTVHRINARAEKKVVDEFIKDFERVTDGACRRSAPHGPGDDVSSRRRAVRMHRLMSTCRCHSSTARRRAASCVRHAPHGSGAGKVLVGQRYSQCATPSSTTAPGDGCREPASTRSTSV